jgi:hypothetical protein
MAHLMRVSGNQKADPFGWLDLKMVGEKRARTDHKPGKEGV